MKNEQTNNNIVQVKEPTEEVLNALYATIFLEHSVFTGNKKAIEQSIEKALEERDKESFIKYTDELNSFMAQYENGLKLTENGFEFLVFFCKKKDHDE
jgi:uncharacterized protein YpiB (UPF0302 family)